MSAQNVLTNMLEPSEDPWKGSIDTMIPMGGYGGEEEDEGDARGWLMKMLMGEDPDASFGDQLAEGIPTVLANLTAPGGQSQRAAVPLQQVQPNSSGTRYSPLSMGF